jgi:hypothetical protein
MYWDFFSWNHFLDLYLEFDDSGRLSTKIYDKWDDFNFKIINFLNMCSSIPVSPAYGVLYNKSLSLYIFTIWKSIVHHRLCRERIYFDKILVSEYKLFKRSNKANLFMSQMSKIFFVNVWRKNVFDIYFRN